MSSIDPKLRLPGKPSTGRFDWKSLPTTQQVISRVALVVFVLVVLYYLLIILHPFFAVLTWAAILATAFYGVFERLERWTDRSRLASILTCLLIILLLVVPVILLLGLMAKESVTAYHRLSAKIAAGPSGELEMLQNSRAFAWIQGKMAAWGLPPIHLADLGLRAVKLMSAFLVGTSRAIFAGFARFVFDFFVVFITLYVLFLHGPQIMDEVRSLCGLKRGHNDAILEQFRGTILASLEGSLIALLLLGILGGLVFLLFGIPAALLWGAVMAVLSLIPVIGTAFVWAPVVIYYLASGHVAKAIALLVTFLVLIMVVDNVVKPLLIQRQAEIHPLWVFLGVVGGVAYFGLLGFVLGPLVVTAFLAILAIRRNEEHREAIVSDG